MDTLLTSLVLRRQEEIVWKSAMRGWRVGRMLENIDHWRQGTDGQRGICAQREGQRGNTQTHSTKRGKVINIKEKEQTNIHGVR